MQSSDPIFIISLLGSLILAQSGCSRAVPGAANGAKATASAPSASAMVATSNACDRRLVSKDDVAGLLSEPIAKVEPLVGDAQSCVFTSANFSTVTVSLRPGLGDATLAEIASGQTNETVTALPGVGDKAVWNGVLREVNATKGNVLCDVGVVGPASGPATAEKVGAVCAKIFAAS